jgi:hypothetical protein
MLKATCDEDEDCDTTCSNTDFEGDQSFVNEWDIPVKFSEAVPCAGPPRARGSDSEEKREILLDNMQSFQNMLMLDAYRNGEGEDDERYSSSDEEDDDF